MSSSEEYRVGPGRPPLHSRFRPGQSGNPNGRSKRPVDVMGAVEAALAELVQMPGKRKRMRKLDVIAGKFVDKAVEGDLRMMQTLLRETRHKTGGTSSRASRAEAQLAEIRESMATAKVRLMAKLERLRAADEQDKAAALKRTDREREGTSR